MMKNYTLPTLIFVLISNFLLAQDCGDRYQTNIFTEVNVTTVQYGSAQTAGGSNLNLSMDIYQPVGDTVENRPVVIFAFGGSFIGGSRNSAELVFMATELAKKGYVCASIDYRLANSALDLIQQQVLVKTVFRAVQDGKAAIRFFRKDAATTNTYKINPDQIFIGGTSAGGILAINLTFADNLSKLPAQWQTWADEIGGLEGNSGNPGYCSVPQGVFGFAGAIADTSYIEANGVPFYGSHSTGDQTVLFNFGPPLNGLAPVDLYGSNLINTRMGNLGLYSVLDVYNNSNHPPLAANQATLDETNDNLTSFLFNILQCNPENMLSGNEKSCDSPNSISANFNLSAVVYPNPSKGLINFTTSGGNINRIAISDAMGKIVKELSKDEIAEGKTDIGNLSKGFYFMNFTGKNSSYTHKLILE